MKFRVSKRAMTLGAAVLCLLGITSLGVAYATTAPASGLKVYVIPKNLGNSYFTTADSVPSGGVCAVAQTLNEASCTETSGAAATPADQIPAIQAAIADGAQVLIVSATDPAALCPTLQGAMQKGITVVTYDSDAAGPPPCRSIYVEDAVTSAIGESEVSIIAKEIHDKGQIAILSAAQTATNQNAWIAYMHTELKKFPHIKLVATVYGNDVPTTATQVAQGLLQKYPHLKGIISPTTVGILAAAQVVDAAHDKGKVIVTGLGTPDAMKKYVLNGTCPQFELWDPAHVGDVAMYAAADLASKDITGAQGETFSAGALGTFKILANNTVLTGPPYVFDKANVAKFNF
jgi:rhamnose transport system substrate-binding protein